MHQSQCMVILTKTTTAQSTQHYASVTCAGGLVVNRESMPNSVSTWMGDISPTTQVNQPPIPPG